MRTCFRIVQVQEAKLICQLKTQSHVAHLVSVKCDVIVVLVCTKSYGLETPPRLKRHKQAVVQSRASEI